tara:strand:- start:150 stop:1130 length:981 start_codon:yes stop_codon:yes gene_type:complete
MYILELLYDLITHTAPEGVNYAMPIPAWVGIASNVFGNIGAKKRARKREREAEAARQAARSRIEEIQSQPLQEILDYRDTAKTLAESKKDLALQRGDRAFSAGMDILQAGDPRTAGLLNQLYTQSVDEGSRVGQTAQEEMLAAEAPVVEDAKRSRDIMLGLDQMDLGMAQEALQAAMGAQEQARQNITNLPVDLMTLQASSPKGQFELFEFGKDGTYVKNMFMGGTISDILNQGDSMVSEGVEEHSVNEKAIVDLEDGNVEALITGQERVENAEDGVAVTNSQQERGMFDAFDSVKDKKNPTEEEMKMIYAAVAKVYTQPQFNPNA